MAASDARLFPRYAQAHRVYFPIFDEDGDLVSGAAGLDSEVSLDGAAFSDCTNEATEIGSSGIYYLDLTAAEMTARAVVHQTKTSSTGAKTAVTIHYPVQDGDIDVNLTAIDGQATDGNNATLNLASLNIINSAGSAVVAKSTGGGGHGIVATGEGSGYGFFGAGSGSNAERRICNFWDTEEGSEPTVTIPAEATFREMLQHQKRRFFNRVTQTSSVQTMYRDNATTALQTMAVSDDGTTQEKGAAS